MSLHINGEAPNFSQQAFYNGKAQELNLYDYQGNDWLVLFSHPKDFTPVCTTELGRGQSLYNEFKKRNTKLLALSVDTVESHEKWIPDIEEVSRSGKFGYPIIADNDRKVSILYDLIHPEADNTFTVRSVFFIDPKHKIRTILTYPHTVGRNFNEILRILDALQAVDEHTIATPADWEKGDKVIIPPSINEIASYKDVEILKSYLRYRSI